MRFKDFYYNNLNEGGAAVHAGPIEQKYIPATLNTLQTEVFNKLGLKKRGVDWELLGSAGKKSAPSGDLDIAVNLLSLMQYLHIDSIDDVIKKVTQTLESIVSDFKFSSGINVFSFAFPIAGHINENTIKDTQKKMHRLAYKGWGVYNDPNKSSFKWDEQHKKFVKIEPKEVQEVHNVQVDLMITDNMDYTVWSYWSPSESESRFKKMGFYRNILLSTLISNIQRDVIQTFDGGGVAKEKKLFLDMSKGLGVKTVSYIGSNNKPVKNPTTISREHITKVPEKIIQTIFGKDATRLDVVSFESIWKKMHSPDFKYKDRVDIIASEVKKALTKLGLPIPEEIEDKV